MVGLSCGYRLDQIRLVAAEWPERCGAGDRDVAGTSLAAARGEAEAESECDGRDCGELGGLYCLPSLSAGKPISLSVNITIRTVHTGLQRRMTRKSGTNVT